MNMTVQIGKCVSCSLFVLLIIVTLVPAVEAHQMFNSAEQKIGGYRIQVATDPEIPLPETPSLLMVVITDSDGNDLYDVNAGLKIFKNDVLIHEVSPRIYSMGHIDMKYAFPESGIYIVEVSITDPYGKVIGSKFNIGILQPFGYIFYSMVIIGAFFPVTLIGVILFLRRRKKAKQTRI